MQNRQVVWNSGEAGTQDTAYCPEPAPNLSVEFLSTVLALGNCIFCSVELDENIIPRTIQQIEIELPSFRRLPLVLLQGLFEVAFCSQFVL